MQDPVRLKAILLKIRSKGPATDNLARKPRGPNLGLGLEAGVPRERNYGPR